MNVSLRNGGAPEVAHRLVMSVIRRAPLKRAAIWRRYHSFLSSAKGARVGRTYFGAAIECDLQDLVQRTIFYFGVWEPTLSRVIDSKLMAGHLFIDIGANVGYYSLLASRLVGPRGGVVAIEASTEIYHRLERNIARNAAANIRAINVAAADRAGEVDIYPGPAHNIGRTSTIAHGVGKTSCERVHAAPLEDILTPDEIRRTSMVKIDVEGAEGPILSHFLSTLERYPPDVEILVELAEAEPSQEDHLSAIFQGFLDAGFHAYGFENLYDIDWYLNWRRPAPPQRLTAYPTHQCDVLFTRNPRALD